MIGYGWWVVVSYWLLVIGNWLLVIGYWLVVYEIVVSCPLSLVSCLKSNLQRLSIYIIVTPPLKRWAIQRYQLIRNLFQYPSFLLLSSCLLSLV
jgi:hypothetical protein